MNPIIRRTKRTNTDFEIRKEHYKEQEEQLKERKEQYRLREPKEPIPTEKTTLQVNKSLIFTRVKRI